MKRFSIFFIAAVFVFGTNAQMNPEETAIVRAILDSAGMKDVGVESVAKADESGRIIFLDLTNNEPEKDGIKYLPPEIGKLTQLKMLFLGKNSILSLPDEIGQLTNLKKLDVQYNELIDLPATIGNLSSLEQFDGRYNQFASLPDEFFKLNKLQWLQLWGNEFKLLPEDIGKLTSLKELYVIHNKLIDLPKCVTRMKSLKYIDFQDNYICNPSPEVRAWLKKKDTQWKSKQNCYGQ